MHKEQRWLGGQESLTTGHRRDRDDGHLPDQFHPCAGAGQTERAGAGGRPLPPGS